MELPIYIDGGKNFIKFDDGFNVVRMMRWGWFEDNIISKYSALVGNEGDVAVTFRSVKYELNDAGDPFAAHVNLLLTKNHTLRPVDHPSSIVASSIMLIIAQVM